MKNHSHDSAHHHSHSHAPSTDGFTRRQFLSALASGALLAKHALAQGQDNLAERFRRMSEEAERNGLADPFKGITTNGQIEPGLFPIHSTGVSTASVRQAAERFLGTLTAE